MADPTEISEHGEALVLDVALAMVNETRIPVMSRDDSIRLVERAKLARKLFRELQLSGISVRKSRGANCDWVDIGLPRSYLSNESTRLAREHRVRLKICEILFRAFPRDFNDSAWCINFQRPRKGDW